MSEERLPYAEHELERTDAIGGRAKRTALAYWSAKLEKALESEEKWAQALKHDEKIDAPATRAYQLGIDRERLEYWKGEVRHARQNLEVALARVKAAWLP